MKHPSKNIRGLLLFSGVLFTLCGCVADGYVSEGVYYGPRRDPWFRDDTWMDGGRRWYHSDPSPSVELYIHPPRHRRR